MEVGFEHATVQGVTIGLDSKKGSMNFVSHAHSDHSKAFSSKIPALSSEQTFELSGFRGERLTLKAVEKALCAKARLLNAGHMFGARQLYLENGGSMLFTGDVKLKANLIASGAETAQADELVLDCTYGKKNYLFPDPQEVYSEMANYIKSEKADTTILMGYSTGKAQELIKFANEFLGCEPVVDKKIASLSRLHNAHGCRLKFVELGTREADELMHGEYIAVVPPDWSLKKRFAKAAGLMNRKTRIIYSTGWSLDQDFSRLCDKAFPLSDHCDFKELLEFVDRVNPKKVYCRWGFVDEFADVLRKKGIEAHSISLKP